MYDLASAGFADHWADLVLTALLTVVGYLVDARLRGIDDRLKELEKQLQEARAEISHSCERIAKVEAKSGIP